MNRFYSCVEYLVGLVLFTTTGCGKNPDSSGLQLPSSSPTSVSSGSLPSSSSVAPALDPSLQVLLDPPAGLSLPDEPTGGKGNGAPIDVSVQVTTEKGKAPGAPAAVKSMVPGFRICARNALIDHPDLSGELVARVELMSNGEFRVKDSKVEKGKIPDDVSRCVAARLAVGQTDPASVRTTLAVRIALRRP